MNNLIRFLKRYYFVFLFLLLEGVAIYLISQNSYHQGSAIVNFANNISGKVYEQSNKITRYFYLASVNEALSKENAILRNQIENSYVKFTEKEMQVEDTVYKQRFTFIEATVISKSINKSIPLKKDDVIITDFTDYEIQKPSRKEYKTFNETRKLDINGLANMEL